MNVITTGSSSLKPPANEIKFGTQSLGGVRNVSIANSAFYECAVGGLKFRRGGVLEGIWITEQLQEQLRVEAFNAFDRREFGAPTTAFGSSSFGVVNSQTPWNRARSSTRSKAGASGPST